jgi:hypothetical protein
MGKPDALSRRANHGSGQGDNDNLMLLAPELFRIHALAGTRLEGEERNILCEVRHSLRDGVQEEAVAKVARELQKDNGRGTVKSAEWSEMRYNRLEYLVKWKGYDESHNQWEERMQLHAKLKIAQFHCKNPGAARYINAALFDSISFTKADLATS